MKKYERYKDSGVQWLGSVPEHWEVMRFKHFMELITEPAKDGKKIGLENIESGTSKYIETESEFEGSGVAFKQNDIVYGKLRPYLRKVWQAEFEGNAVGDFFVFRSKKNSTAKYLKYLLLSEGFTSIATGSTEGAKMPRVSSQFVLSLDYALPTISEQETIANYLDSQVSKINAVITEKEKMISDMEKYRSSLISETVTKGLNPDAPMKESGVDWIGEIPEDWQLIKLKYMATLKSGTNLNSDQIKDKDLYPVFGGNGHRGYYDKYSNEGDYVLIGRQGALCGNINYAHGRFWATEHAVVCYPNKKYSLIWFGELLRTMNLNQYSIASAQPGLSVERIKELTIPAPPINEQEQIASFLDSQTSKIDSLISELKSQIEDLKSYKQSLITEAVTGQVDVRDWTPNE